MWKKSENFHFGILAATTHRLGSTGFKNEPPMTLFAGAGFETSSESFLFRANAGYVHMRKLENPMLLPDGQKFSSDFNAGAFGLHITVGIPIL